MEKEKNNGKKILIGVLVVVIIVLASFCVFLLVVRKSLLNDALSNNNCPECQKCESSGIDLTNFIGTYTYKGEYSDISINERDKIKIPDNAWESGKMAYETLKLESSGIAYASAGNNFASGYSVSGKWYISNEEIIVINDSCEPIIMGGEAIYPNCRPIWKYTYRVDNGAITIISNNNTVTTVNLKMN